MTEPNCDSEREFWTIARDGRPQQMSSYPTREMAERQLDYYREREAKGQRPDVTTEGLYVCRVSELTDDWRHQKPREGK